MPGSGEKSGRVELHGQSRQVDFLLTKVQHRNWETKAGERRGRSGGRNPTRQHRATTLVLDASVESERRQESDAPERRARYDKQEMRNIFEQD